jgi:hypothetical protein
LADNDTKQARFWNDLALSHQSSPLKPEMLFAGCKNKQRQPTTTAKKKANPKTLPSSTAD